VKRLAILVFILAAVWIIALLQRGLPLAVDEIEYFRATRWTSLGQLPYRDFWEHHPPLQWLLFAPVARFASGAGAGAIVFMRWMQMPLWIAICWLGVKLARRAEVQDCGWVVALLLLVLSPTFLERAIEYRVDVVGNAAFLAAITLAGWGNGRKGWPAFGALMSLAVLANMRLAPLVVLAAALFLVCDPSRRAWRWNAQALRMSLGVAATVAGFLGYLYFTRSLAGFLDGVLDYNRITKNVLEVRTFRGALFRPFTTADLGGMLFWLAGAAGLIRALREFRRPGPLQVAALLTIGGIGTVAAMQVQYDYHFQTVWILLLPLAADAVARLRDARWRTAAVATGLAGVLLSVAKTAPEFGAAMGYQDEVMSAADRMTIDGEAVLDGSGFALRRTPAWRYWFLPTGIRFLAGARKLDPYDGKKMMADPPAAVITDYRFILYMRMFPDVAAYGVRHYVPLYRNLWIPGMTEIVGPGSRRIRWVAPRAGQYDIHVSDLLAKHPWFSRPLEYVTTIGSRAPLLEIPLQRLPGYGAAALQWSVDGKPVPANQRTIQLRKGAVVEVAGSAPVPAGVMLVPHGVETLCQAPGEEIVF
jgi:hypothetical protein